MELRAEVVQNQQIAGQQRVQRVVIAAASAEVFLFHLPQKVDRRIIENIVSVLQHPIGNGEREVGFSTAGLPEHQNAAGVVGELAGVFLTEEVDLFHCLIAAAAVFGLEAPIIVQVEILEAAPLKLNALVQFPGGQLGDQIGQTGAVFLLKITGVIAFFAGVVEFQIVLRIAVFFQKPADHLLSL